MFPLSRFLNQTVTYQPFEGVNSRDDPVYGSSQTVAARFVEIDREHYARDEDVRQARSKVWLGFQPVLRSLISGREVIHTEAMVQVSGDNPGWLAVLR